MLTKSYINLSFTIQSLNFRHSSIPVLLGWLVEKPGKNKSAKLEDEVPKRGEDKGN